MSTPIKFTSRPEKQSEVDSLRAKLGTGFTSMAKLISNVRKPLPTQTGDGTDLPLRDDPPYLVKQVNDSLHDMAHLGIDDVSTLLQVAAKGAPGEEWDDKVYLMEKLIQTASGLPDDSKMRKDVTGTLLTQLYNDLQHPPQSYLGKDYTYRSADGSFNSLMHPNLGKAGTPYARTSTPKMMQQGALPDPGVIFDSVMTRKHHDKHPNKISSVLFYLASIIIHDLFRTDHEDFTISKTSSYLDLSPLYGSNQDEQDEMRTFKDGRIYPDCFSETRLLSFPPGVGCLLIMFNRFHNYVVERLALINEGGQFTKPSGDVNDKDPEVAKKVAGKWKKYDNDLFQTGRLITCGLYINIITVDYVRTILNINKTNSNWSLNPRMEIKGTPVAEGNQVAAEFNLVYRWHSAISDRDEKWTEDLFKELFPGTDPTTMSWHKFVVEADKMEKKLRAMKPKDRPFAKLDRLADGKFDDDDLAPILVDSIRDCANAYGANRVPACMRVVEQLGIQQARAWNVSSLNEFRKYFGLKPHQTFEDINSDPYVADQLRHLYDTPDQVELYVGLVTEEGKKPTVPGAGLCPPYTVSRAVLSDAVALVRGDRFYTTDWHPKKLTNWGFQEIASDLSISNGTVFYKLFLRGLPNHFKPNSIYVHFPMTVPEEMEAVMTTLGRKDRYDFSVPKKIPQPTMIFSYPTAKKILLDQQTFNVTWGEAMEFLMGKPAKNFMLAGDGPKNADSRKMMYKGMYIEGKWDKEVREWYEKMTERLLKERSYKLGNVNQVDIIRDVINMTHVHFAAEMFNMPLKTKEFPRGVFTEAELYLILAAVFICVFFDMDPAMSFALRQKSHEAVQILGNLVEMNVRDISKGGVLDKLKTAMFPEKSGLPDYGVHLIERLLKTGMPPDELVWGHIMGTAGGMVPNQGQLFSQVLEYYLNEGKEHLPAINKLAKESGDASFDKLMRYFLEGMRINGESGVFRWVMKPVTLEDGPMKHSFQPGDKIMVNLNSAAKDPAVFPDPMTVKLDRDMDSYITLGMGPHQCLGWRMTQVALTAMLKVICRLDNLRPAPGPQGVVKKILNPMPGDGNKLPDEWKFHVYMTSNHESFMPFPQNLKVNWD